MSLKIPTVRKRANSASTSSNINPIIREIPNDTPDSNLIEGTTKFALAQLLSKILTFALNQVLLRFLSASKLGVANQIDLAYSSIMSLSRDGIRTANQRQPTVKYRYQSEFTTDGRSIIDTELGKMQETINLGYISSAIGCMVCTIVTIILSWKSSWPLSATLLVFIAAIIELFQEPLFLLLQLKQKLGVRAVSESAANLARILTVMVFILWFKTQPFVSFAFGQLVYAITLSVVNFREVSKLQSEYSFSLLPSKIWTSNAQIQTIFITMETRNSVYEFCKQQVMKYLLTEGDRIAVSFLASLEEQGEYALCCNYGSLLVRFLLYPVEEGLRAYFSSNKDPVVLNTVLRAYTYLGMLAAGFGPLVAPFAMSILVKQNAFSNAGKVLSVYCFYIPILAWNGALEAYIQATASLHDIRLQAMVMVLVFSIFIMCTYLFLSIMQLGSVGLVYAQIVSSICRLAFSILHSEITKVCIPNKIVVAVTVCGIALAQKIGKAGRFLDVLVFTLLGSLVLLTIGLTERDSIYSSYTHIRHKK